MTHLADTSALLLLQRGPTPWDEAAERGLVAICEPALAEALAGVDAAHRARAERRMLRLYAWADVPAGVWETVSRLRSDLDVPVAHRGASVAGLVIAATAIRLGLTLLHDDDGFETIARHAADLRQERLRPCEAQAL